MRARDLTDGGGTPTAHSLMSRAGAPTMLLGVVLALGSVTAAVVVDSPTLGIMFGLATGFMAAGYLLLMGIVRLRSRDADAFDDVPPSAEASPGSTWVGAPGARSWRCWMSHREAFVPRVPDAPPHWECRRCGAQSVGHLRAGRRWMCHVVEHRYDPVLARSDVPAHWRCRRCGRRRFTEPLSMGETLEGTRANQMLFRRDDGS